MIIGFPYRFWVTHGSIFKKRKVDLKYINEKETRKGNKS